MGGMGGCAVVGGSDMYQWGLMPSQEVTTYRRWREVGGMGVVAVSVGADTCQRGLMCSQGLHPRLAPPVGSVRRV